MPGIPTGFCFRHSVEKTADKGLGVFAREPIEAGSVVWRHVPGGFVVYDEQSFQAKIANMPPAEVIHELTHVHGFEDFPGCLILALDDGIRINHSQDPNLTANNAAPTEISFDASSDEYLHKVAEALVDDRYSLVAKRDIECGEELTNDYSADDDCPAYYDTLCEEYGVTWDFVERPVW